MKSLIKEKLKTMFPVYFEALAVAGMWACSAFLAFTILYCMIKRVDAVTITFTVAREQYLELGLLLLIVIAGGIVWYRIVKRKLGVDNG